MSSNPRTNFNIQGAYDFYRTVIYNVEHQDLLTRHGFHVAGSVAPINWEVFVAILTQDRKKTGYGSDLERYEVKSSVAGASFEYQYHRRGGKAKLKDDMEVDHVFISYRPDYAAIAVRLLDGKVLQPFFEQWLPGLIANYAGPNRRQRYRKSIPYSFVKKHGKTILRTNNGELVGTRITSLKARSNKS